MQPLVTLLKSTDTRMGDHAARSGMHFAMHHPLLTGLVVLASTIALLGSALVSRASAQEAWSGYLVIKASLPTRTVQGITSSSNEKAAYYFDGRPESVVSDDGAGSDPRRWQQRVRWTGYKRASSFGERQPDTCRYTDNVYVAGSGLGTALVDLYGPTGNPPSSFYLWGGNDEPMWGRRIATPVGGGCGKSDTSGRSEQPCKGPSFGPAPQGVDTVTLAGRKFVESFGSEIGCGQAENGDAIWNITRAPNPPQCSNGIDDDGDSGFFFRFPQQLPEGGEFRGIDYSGGIPDYKDPQCTSDADNSEAS